MSKERKYIKLRIKSAIKLLALNKEKKAKNTTINVVFLAQYIPAWNKFEKVYKEMLDNSMFRPYIICIPSDINDKKVIEENQNDTYEYFTEQGYDVINAIDKNIKWYDLQQLNPQYVFYTRPYNMYLPEEYKSDVVSKYADICLIMYGINISKDECRVIFNMDFVKDLRYYFAECDYTKRYFIKQFPISTALGIRKVYNVGATGLEQILANKEKETDEWDFYNGDFKVLWTPRWTTNPELGGSNFFVYYKDIIEYAKEHKDIALLCRPHPMMFDNFIKTGEMTQEEVDSYRELIENTENVKLNETKEYDAVLWKSDVMISDYSGIAPEYFVTEKPLIYCDTNNKTSLSPHIGKMLEGCYVVNSSEEMFNYLEQLRIGNDPLKENRPKIIKEAFGTDIDKCSSKIIKILSKK